MKEYHGSAMLGLTSGNLNFEGPIIKDRTSFNASFRRSWLDALSAPGLAIYNKIQKKKGEKFSARYAFTDLNLKVNHHINDRSQAYVNFYFGQDFLKGGSSEFSVGDDITPFENKDFGKMRWGNIALSSGWSYVFNNKMFGTVTLAYSHYQSKLKQRLHNTTEPRVTKIILHVLSRPQPETVSMISESMRTSTIFLPRHIISVMAPTIFTIVSARNISRKRPPRICLRPNELPETSAFQRMSWLFSLKMTGDISHCPG